MLENFQYLVLIFMKFLPSRGLGFHELIKWLVGTGLFSICRRGIRHNRRSRTPRVREQSLERYSRQRNHSEPEDLIELPHRVGDRPLPLTIYLKGCAPSHKKEFAQRDRVETVDIFPQHHSGGTWAFSVLQPSMVSKASGVSILATFRKSHRIIRRRSSTFLPKHCLPIQAVKYPPNRDEFTKGSLVDLVQPVQSNSELELRKPDSEDTAFIGSILQALSRAKRRLILQESQTYNQGDKAEVCGGVRTVSTGQSMYKVGL